MSTKPCNCGDPKGHARATGSSVFQCLINAQNDPENAKVWERRASDLESKFITAHGKHYSLLEERSF